MSVDYNNLLNNYLNLEDVKNILLKNNITSSNNITLQDNIPTTNDDFIANISNQIKELIKSDEDSLKLIQLLQNFILDLNKRSNSDENKDDLKKIKVEESTTTSTTSSATSTINSDSDAWKLALHEIIKELRKNENSFVFEEPVPKADYPDYYDIITEPMDFQTFLSNVQSGVYSNVKEALTSLRKIWLNCFQYNSRYSAIGKFASTLGTECESLITDYLGAEYSDLNWKKTQKKVIEPINNTTPPPSNKTFNLESVDYKAPIPSLSVVTIRKLMKIVTTTVSNDELLSTYLSEYSKSNFLYSLSAVVPSTDSSSPPVGCFQNFVEVKSLKRNFRIGMYDQDSTIFVSHVRSLWVSIENYSKYLKNLSLSTSEVQDEIKKIDSLIDSCDKLKEIFEYNLWLECEFVSSNPVLPRSTRVASIKKKTYEDVGSDEEEEEEVVVEKVKKEPKKVQNIEELNKAQESHEQEIQKLFSSQSEKPKDAVSLIDINVLFNYPLFSIEELSPYDTYSSLISCNEPHKHILIKKQCQTNSKNLSLNIKFPYDLTEKYGFQIFNIGVLTANSVNSTNLECFHPSNTLYPINYTTQSLWIIRILPTNLDKNSQPTSNPLTYLYPINIKFRVVSETSTPNTPSYLKYQVLTETDIIISESVQSIKHAYDSMIGKERLVFNSISSKLRRCRAVFNRISISTDMKPFLADNPLSPISMLDIHKRLVQGFYDNEFQFAFDFRLLLRFGVALGLNQMTLDRINILFDEFFINWVLQVDEVSVKELVSGEWDDWLTMRYYDKTDYKPINQQAQFITCGFCSDFFNPTRPIQQQQQPCPRCSLALEKCKNNLVNPPDSIHFHCNSQKLYKPFLRDKKLYGWYVVAPKRDVMLANYGASSQKVPGQYLSPSGNYYPITNIPNELDLIITEETKFLDTITKSLSFKNIDIQTHKHPLAEIKLTNIMRKTNFDKNQILTTGKLVGLNLVQETVLIWYRPVRSVSNASPLGVTQIPIWAPFSTSSDCQSIHGFSGLETPEVKTIIEGMDNSIFYPDYIYQNAKVLSDELIKIYLPKILPIKYLKESQSNFINLIRKKKAKFLRQNSKPFYDSSFTSIPTTINSHNENVKNSFQKLCRQNSLPKFSYDIVIALWDYLSLNQKELIVPFYSFSEILTSILPSTLINDSANGWAVDQGSSLIFKSEEEFKANNNLSIPIPSTYQHIFEEIGMVLTDNILNNTREYVNQLESSNTNTTTTSTSTSTTSTASGWSEYDWQDFLLVSPCNVITWKRILRKLLLVYSLPIDEKEARNLLQSCLYNNYYLYFVILVLIFNHPCIDPFVYSKKSKDTSSTDPLQNLLLQTQLKLEHLKKEISNALYDSNKEEVPAGGFITSSNYISEQNFGSKLINIFESFYFSLNNPSIISQEEIVNSDSEQNISLKTFYQNITQNILYYIYSLFNKLQFTFQQKLHPTQILYPYSTIYKPDELNSPFPIFSPRSWGGLSGKRAFSNKYTDILLTPYNFFLSKETSHELDYFYLNALEYTFFMLGNVNSYLYSTESKIYILATLLNLSYVLPSMHLQLNSLLNQFDITFNNSISVDEMRDLWRAKNESNSNINPLKDIKKCQSLLFNNIPSENIPDDADEATKSKEKELQANLESRFTTYLKSNRCVITGLDFNNYPILENWSLVRNSFISQLFDEDEIIPFSSPEFDVDFFDLSKPFNLESNIKSPGSFSLVLTHAFLMYSKLKKAISAKHLKYQDSIDSTIEQILSGLPCNKANALSNSIFLPSSPIGYDRHGNTYWIFNAQSKAFVFSDELGHGGKSMTKSNPNYLNKNVSNPYNQNDNSKSLLKKGGLLEDSVIENNVDSENDTFTTDPYIFMRDNTGEWYFQSGDKLLSTLMNKLSTSNLNELNLRRKLCEKFFTFSSLITQNLILNRNSMQNLWRDKANKLTNWIENENLYQGDNKPHKCRQLEVLWARASESRTSAYCELLFGNENLSTLAKSYKEAISMRQKQIKEDFLKYAVDHHPQNGWNNHHEYKRIFGITACTSATRIHSDDAVYSLIKTSLSTSLILNRKVSNEVVIPLNVPSYINFLLRYEDLSTSEFESDSNDQNEPNPHDDGLTLTPNLSVSSNLNLLQNDYFNTNIPPPASIQMIPPSTPLNQTSSYVNTLSSFTSLSEYFEYLLANAGNISAPVNFIKYSKPVVMYHLETKEPLRIFPSGTIASKFLEISQSGISLCLSGSKNDYFGFKWKVYDGPPVDFDSIEHLQMPLPKIRELQSSFSKVKKPSSDIKSINPISYPSITNTAAYKPFNTDSPNSISSSNLNQIRSPINTSNNSPRIIPPSSTSNPSNPITSLPTQPTPLFSFTNTSPVAQDNIVLSTVMTTPIILKLKAELLNIFACFPEKVLKWPSELDDSAEARINKEGDEVLKKSSPTITSTNVAVIPPTTANTQIQAIDYDKQSKKAKRRIRRKITFELFFESLQRATTATELLVLTLLLEKAIPRPLLSYPVNYIPSLYAPIPPSVDSLNNLASINITETDLALKIYTLDRVINYHLIQGLETVSNCFPYRLRTQFVPKCTANILCTCPLGHMRTCFPDSVGYISRYPDQYQLAPITDPISQTVHPSRIFKSININTNQNAASTANTMGNSHTLQFINSNLTFNSDIELYTPYLPKIQEVTYAQFI